MSKLGNSRHIVFFTAVRGRPQLIRIAPLEMGAEGKARSTPRGNAAFEVDTGALTSARAVFNARVGIGAVVTGSLRKVVSPGHCPQTIQMVNNVSRVTANAVKKLDSIELPTVQ